MSAITGILNRRGSPVKWEHAKEMNDILSHRGPDGSDIWLEDSVALGHQMLQTTPESLKEKLPLHDANCGLVITADARIDNRDELSEILNLNNNVEVPDSLYILKAYQKWGEKCPEKLLGDFSFAIWDKNNNKLFCARDHMGVKPFYYYLSNDHFFFATEIKAIFTIPSVHYNINEEKVAFHLIFIDDKESTFYKNIYRLTPAHSLTITSDKIKLRKYWELDPEHQIIMDTDEDYFKAFRTIFAEAVHCRLRSAYPLGFELSGGLDSSSVVCTAKGLLNNKLNTFSFISEDVPDADERYYIEKVVSTGGISSHLINLDKISPLSEIENISWFLEQPFDYITISFFWKLFNEMHSNNIRVSLNGQDGNSVVSHGQLYFKELALTLQWKKLIKEIQNAASVSKKYNDNLAEGFYLKVYYNQTFWKIFLNVLVQIVPESLKKIYRFLKGKSGYRHKPNLFLLSHDFEEDINAENYLNELYLNPKKKLKSPKQFHHNIIGSYAHQNVLERYDRLTAAFSIEPRYPFYDKRLIEFCYGIPTDLKYRNGWKRFIQRMAMENILPKEVQWRYTDQDFIPVFQKNFLRFEKNRLKQMFNDYKPISHYVDLDKLEAIYQEYIFNQEPGGNISSAQYVSDSVDLFATLTLWVWLLDTNIQKVY